VLGYQLNIQSLTFQMVRTWLHDFAIDKHTRLTNVHEGVSQVKLSPDGKQFMYFYWYDLHRFNEWNEKYLDRSPEPSM